MVVVPFCKTKHRVIAQRSIVIHFIEDKIVFGFLILQNVLYNKENLSFLYEILPIFYTFLLLGRRCESRFPLYVNKINFSFL
jgi:hypothetical protein